MTATQAQVSPTLVLLIVIHLTEDIDALLELLVEDLAEDFDAPVCITDNVSTLLGLLAAEELRQDDPLLPLQLLQRH